MDLDVIFQSMSEEEKQEYFTKNTIDYYKYIESLPEFINMKEKLNKKEKLTDREWEFILSRLFLVFSHSLEEENRIGLAGELFLFLSKLNMKVLKKNSASYNRLYKWMQCIISSQQDSTINEDLLDGICIVNARKEEEDLENLLKQYQEANRFKENKKAFLKEYQTTSMNELSNNEKLYIHAYNDAYEKEKKLVKEYTIYSK